jgi:serine/threonine-protein kinase
MAARDLVGQQVDNYHIEQFLDRGGMADVYLALDTNLGRTVALKILNAELVEDASALARFQLEARTVARLNHPNIVQVYAIGVTPLQRPYLAMQYIRGGSLQEKLEFLARNKQRLGVREALDLTRQVALALHHAHAAGIVHRDLKPSNILLQPDDTPVLSDLGIAAVQQETTRLTQTGGIIGTPHYMSPEQIGGHPVDGRADIYALGIILYELLAGHPPFSGDTPLVILHQHVYQQPPPLSLHRPGLAAMTYRVVDTCLKKGPKARFPSAKELVYALDQALHEEGFTLAPRSGTVLERSQAPSAAWPPRRTAVIAGVILPALIAIGLWLLLFTLNESGGEQPMAVTPPGPAHTATFPPAPSVIPPSVQPSVTTQPPTSTPLAVLATQPATLPVVEPEVTIVEAGSPAIPSVPAFVPITTPDVTAVRLATPPVVDGALNDWPALVPVLSTYRVYEDESWDGSEDLVIAWRLGWDNDYFYLASSVQDEVHVQEQRGNQIFKGDSVDLQVDSDRAGDLGPGINEDDFQITLSPGNFRNLTPSAFRWQGRSNGRYGDASAEGILIGAQQTAGGYTLEAAIPWRQLSVAPQPGLVIGIALNATDNDTPGTAVQELLLSHVPGRLLTDPSSWGTLTLE